MNSTWICQACNHENKPEARECAKCGKPFDADTILSLITRAVPAIQSEAPAPKQAAVPTDLPADALALSVVGQERPIVVRGSRRITLGRLSPGQPPPSVDLTDYNALELGVSRRHAIITFNDGLCTVQDMGSTNGTWLNERRLPPHKFYPLYSGDQLRLGQLRLYVHFHAAQAADTRSTEEIVLKDLVLEKGEQQLTPHYVNTSLCPYLNALADIQAIFDEIKGRVSSEICILSVKYPPSFSMSLRGATETIRMVEEVILPHRNDKEGTIGTSNDKDISGVLQGKNDNGQHTGDSKGSEGAKQALGATRHIGMDGRDKLPEAVPEHLLRELALQAIRRVEPDLSEEERQSFVKKLAPLIEILLTSSIEISRG